MPYPRVLFRNETTAPSDLETGEILVDKLKDNEGIYIKNNSDKIVKIGFSQTYLNKKIEEAFSVSGCTCGGTGGGGNNS